MKNITVLGKKWFDKVNGNTYHSVNVIIKGKEYYSGSRYGYDDHYKQTAFEIVRNHIKDASYSDFLRQAIFNCHYVDKEREL